eukprot:TRINITY_DN1317_c0_g1_i5.p4 TRINITY_DN1317_c0_g1~~TRINITY_DN1317_c0_g1_i5.p4  ORF type:complete len:223 (+),score=44.50 TRINITY_DN1317_c0_g1_i5:1534-2202(+)
MQFNRFIVNKKIIRNIILGIIPIIIIIGIIIGRKIITPSNDDIVNKLKNIKVYSCDVEYVFKNRREEFTEKTKQYYRFDKGSRIEFQDYYKRVKVYNGSDIKVQENNDKYSMGKNIDIIYPLAFIENIFSNEIRTPIHEIKEEWGEGEYILVNIKYNMQNKYLCKGEFYIDKKKRKPVLLKILDVNNEERVLILSLIHISEPTRPLYISYAVFCLKKKKKKH